MQRVEGWEKALFAAVEDARAKPYAIGRHDCALWATGVVRAITGVDPFPGLGGRYRSKRGSLRLIAAEGKSLGDATTRRLKACGLCPGGPVWPRLAHRGDPVLFRDAEKQDHLGICIGADAVVMGEAGLLWIPLNACVQAWNV